jgi:hypothetical protein
VHLPRGFAAEAGEDTVTHVAFLGLLGTSRASRRTAARAARGLILETLRGIEFLLACRKNEAVATVFAGDFFVNVGQCGESSLAAPDEQTLRIL